MWLKRPTVNEKTVSGIWKSTGNLLKLNYTEWRNIRFKPERPWGGKLPFEVQHCILDSYTTG
jgi:hypothetical protein